MSTRSKTIDRVEAFILLHGGSHEEFDSLIQAVESAQGRVLHAVPPFAMMALLPSPSLRKIRALRSVEMVETRPISNEYYSSYSPAIAEAIYVWNEHLHAREHAATPQHKETPLSWDAPGHLPPDPPRKVLDRLRRQKPDGK